MTLTCHWTRITQAEKDEFRPYYEARGEKVPDRIFIPGCWGCLYEEKPNPDLCTCSDSRACRRAQLEEMSKHELVSMILWMEGTT